MKCKEAHLVLCEAQDRPLSWSRRLALRWHLCICDQCTRFKQQLGFMRKAMQHYRSGQ